VSAGCFALITLAKTLLLWQRFDGQYGKAGTPEQLNFCDWDHVQAAIIQTIKQDKPLYNYFTILKH